MKVLEQYPSYLEFRDRTRSAASAAIGHDDHPALAASAEPVAAISPQDLVDRAVAENRAAMQGELLKKALALDPKGFELLVLRLLNAMGYGRNGGLVEHSGRSGDGGIDGIISQDPLGLDRIYLQAKRVRARPDCVPAHHSGLRRRSHRCPRRPRRLPHHFQLHRRRPHRGRPCERSHRAH